jgi:hypothetical protein
VWPKPWSGAEKLSHQMRPTLATNPIAPAAELMAAATANGSNILRRLGFA